jgi:hypothetical protein
METSYYHKNREMNYECVRAIDEAIIASEYETYFCNLELAAMSVINKHGFERVNAVLAHQLQKHNYDGRYSEANKKWAQGFVIHKDTHSFLRSHATLVEDFATHVRKMYDKLGAERFSLLGQEEHGEYKSNNGYEIIRSFMFSKNESYVIAHNPDAVSHYVCWKLSISDDGERRYDWGIYGDKQAAVDGYNARLYVHFN